MTLWKTTAKVYNYLHSLIKKYKDKRTNKHNEGLYIRNPGRLDQTKEKILDDHWNLTAEERNKATKSQQKSITESTKLSKEKSGKPKKNGWLNSAKK